MQALTVIVQLNILKQSNRKKQQKKRSSKMPKVWLTFTYYTVLTETNSEFSFRGFIHIFRVFDGVSPTEWGHITDDFSHGFHCGLVLKILEIFVVSTHKCWGTPHWKQTLHSCLDLIRKSKYVYSYQILRIEFLVLIKGSTEMTITSKNISKFQNFEDTEMQLKFIFRNEN